MIPTTANAPAPLLGRPGASTAQAAINQVTTRVNAGQELDAALLGGPGFYGGNIGQREENDGTHEVQGSHVGQKHTGWRGTQSTLRSWQSPWTITSVLEAEEGARVVRRGGGVLQVRRHHGGPGVIEDDAALIRLHDESGADGNLIEDQTGEFVVDQQRRVFANAGIFRELWVGGVPVLSLLAGAGVPDTEFTDSEFRVTDQTDTTKRMGFEVSGVTAGATRLLTVPDASGTIALTSDLAALGDFADNLFHVHSSGDADRRGRFDASGISDATTRVYILPDVDGTLALTSDVVTSHGALSDLTTGDDHTQYLLLAGRFGGQDVTDTLRIDAVVSPDFLATGAVTGLGTVVVPLSFEPSDPADNGTAGDGWRIPFVLENDASVAKDAGAIQVEWSDPTNGSEDSIVTIDGMQAGLPAPALLANLATGQAALCGQFFDFSAPADGDTLVLTGGVWTPTPAGGGPGGGATVGTASVDFGAFPGATDASVVVTGQTGIVSGSVVQAWILPAATVDHTADEHLVEPIRVLVTDIVAGTGFTIRAFYDPPKPQARPGYTQAGLGRQAGRGLQDRQQIQPSTSQRTYGVWSVAWSWQ